MRSILRDRALPLLAVLLLCGCAAGTQGPPPMPTGPAPQPTIPSPTLAPLSNSLSGIVLDEDGRPVEGATVRVQATQNSTLTNSSGEFQLAGLVDGEPTRLSAWREGYYCSEVMEVSPPRAGIRMELRLYQATDNPDYAWVPPTGEGSCYSCKPGVTQVWLDNDAHGRSAQNIRFLTMFLGTDVQGNQSPPTRFISTKDYGHLPLRPDDSQPYYGPGYKLDFPDSNGNCAACHLPGAALENPLHTDPTVSEGVDEFGIHCDFCHKVADVMVEAETGLPQANMPGVMSMDIRRPFTEDPERYQLFFGTFDDDNVPEEDTRLPLIEESRFCAGCHYGIFWDTLVYNSYGEWLASPYSDPQSGKTCQQCHTPAPTVLDGQALTNVAPGKGGVERDPNTIHAHTFPGAASQELLQSAVTLSTEARRDGERLQVDVHILNDLTGHHVPTDSPMRHLILLVQATDNQAKALQQLDGPVLPDWAGEGDPADGYYAGLPGEAYAKVLTELWTEVSPTGAYWNPTRVEYDNRIAAYASADPSFTFSAPAGAANVQVTLLYRRAFKELMDQKGWSDPDILMEEVRIQIPAGG